MMLNKLVIALLLVSICPVANAVSNDGTAKIKTYKPRIGKAPRRSDVSIFIRKIYKGVRPRITKTGPNSFHVRFIYKNELKRADINYIVKGG